MVFVKTSQCNGLLPNILGTVRIMTLKRDLARLKCFRFSCWLSYPGLEGGKYFFQILKEGDETSFATDDEADRLLWIQAIYRATGQKFKPELPNQTVLSHVSVSQINSGQIYS